MKVLHISVFFFCLTLVCSFLIEVDPHVDETVQLDDFGLSALFGIIMLKIFLYTIAGVLPINLNDPFGASEGSSLFTFDFGQDTPGRKKRELVEEKIFSESMKNKLFEVCKKF